MTAQMLTTEEESPQCFSYNGFHNPNDCNTWSW